MRYVLSVLVAGALFAGVNRPDVAKIDRGFKNVPLRYVAPQAKSINVVYIDTAANQYGLFSTVQDPLAVLGTKVVMAERIYGDGTLGSGALGVVFSTDEGGTWVKDWPVNGGLPGDTINPDIYWARYPTAWASDLYPGASWPELDYVGSSPWGQVGVGNEPDWSTQGFYGVLSNDFSAHKVIGKCCGSNGLQGVIAVSGAYIGYFSYDPATGDFITPPTILRDSAYLEAAVCFNNQLYAFVFDLSAGTFGYHIVTNGSLGDFNALDLTGIPGEIWWDDFAVLNDGSVIGIYATRTDTSYVSQGPYYADQVWVKKGDTAIRLDSGSGHVVYYPQLAYDPNNGTVVALWAQADAVYDSTIEGFWGDIYIAVSTDNGNTFGAPQNLTATPNVNEQLPELAKEVGANGKFWLIYATAADGSNGDLFNGIATSGTFDVYPTQYHVGYFTPVSVGENNNAPVTVVRVLNDLRNKSLTVNFNATRTGEGTFELYNVSGRLVKTVKARIVSGNNNVRISVADLPSGVYVLQVTTPEFKRTVKTISLR